MSRNVGQGTISWSLKKQPIVTLLSTEAEHVALTHTAKELIWLRGFLGTTTPDVSTKARTALMCNNQAAIVLSGDAMYHTQTKHVDIQCHFIRQTVEARCTKIEYCPTAEMVADIFTKSLGRVKFKKF
jgi:hypothetical protein